MKRLFLVISIISVFASVKAQVIHDFSGIKTSRNKKNADKDGAYRVVVVPDKTELDKQDELTVSLYVTGYGVIGMSKFFIVPSSVALFDSSSEVIYGFAKDGNGFSYGANSRKSIAQQWIMTNNEDAMGYRDSISLDNYFDADSDTSTLGIISERFIKKAPITLKLRISKNAPTGYHKMKVYFTYFNGHQWEVSFEEFQFRINTFTEQYSSFISWAGLILAAIAVFPIFKPILLFYKGLFTKLKSKKITTVARKP